MTKRIFRNTMIVVLFVVLLCGVFIMGVVYDYYSERLSDEMINEAKYISQGVEFGGSKYLEQMDDADIRITWIASDGTVLYDNKADVASMDNHAMREEVKEAMTSATGNSTRYSKTLSEKTAYNAVRLSDGSVIRVANTQSSIIVILLGMMQPVVVVLMLAFALSGLLAYRLSKQIIAPLDNIDLDCPEETNVYEEMAPFVRKIVLQNREINETMQEMKAQQNEFAIITENMQEGFIVIDRNANVLSHNTSALRLFGINCEAEHRSVLILNRTEEFRNAVDTALEGRHNEHILQVGERFYHIYLNPVFDDEQVAGAIIIVTDVTEKEERENLRREFSANVSHELKTPLTSISGIAEIMKNGIVDSADIPEFAGRIYSEARRLINLVEDIIKLSQLDEDNTSVDKEIIDLYDMAEYVAEHLRPVASSRGISIEVEGEHLSIMGVRAVIEEMVYNLCDNAVKYNNDNGSVTVTVGKTDEPDYGVSICVSDTGIGIAKEYQERIFERFYRVDKSHSKEIGGTGLGLSIVKHAAKMHAACVDIESVPGKGTDIAVKFYCKAI